MIQLGEEKWRIKNIGVHSLDIFKKNSNKNKKELGKYFKFDFNKPYCLVTFHPVTIELKKIKIQLKNLFYCLKKTKLNIIFTYPNADSKNEIIIKSIISNFNNKNKYLFIKNCGNKNYASIMKNCLFVIGNSSSGLVEAASLKIPSINIGTRQDGKFKPANVIDSDYSKKKILKSIKKALNFKFKKKVKKLKNPYQRKISVNKVVDILAKLKINDKLLRKKFIKY